jgi:hypothetical protein
MEDVSSKSVHALITGNTVIPGLLYADDLAVSAFTVTGLQKVSHKVENYCDKQGLKTIVRKIKIVVSEKKGG